MDRADKLHLFYQGYWTNEISKHFPEEYNTLVELWKEKGYHEDVQTLTDDHIKKLDQVIQAKSDELLKI